MRAKLHYLAQCVIVDTWDRWLLSFSSALAQLSHSQDVTGIVQAICKRMLMFGKIAWSQSLIAFAGDAGLSSGGIGN